MRKRGRGRRVDGYCDHGTSAMKNVESFVCCKKHNLWLAGKEEGGRGDGGMSNGMTVEMIQP